MNGAAYSGHLPLSDSFAWLGTAPALVMLIVAAPVEVRAYYVSGIDNLLDTLATSAALVAGTVLSAAVMTDVPPMVKWTAAVIAGGGVAGLTQGAIAILTAETVTCRACNRVHLVNVTSGRVLLVPARHKLKPLA